MFLPVLLIELLAALFRDEASVVDARLLGAEDESGAPIGIEDLLGDSKVGFDRNLLGVYSQRGDFE